MKRHVTNGVISRVAVLAMTVVISWTVVMLSTGLDARTHLRADEGRIPARARVFHPTRSLRTLPSLLPLITDEAVAGAVAYPSQFFDSDVVRSLPIEVVTADLVEDVGFDVRGIEFVIAFVERSETQPMSTGMILRFNENVQWRQVPDEVVAKTVLGKMDGRLYRKGMGPLDLSLFRLDEKTLIIAPDSTLKRMLAKRLAAPSDDSISHQLAQGLGKSLDVHIAVNTSSFRPLVAMHVRQLDRNKDVWRAFAQLLDAAERIELRARLSRQLAIGVLVESTEADDSEGLQSVWDVWSATLQERLTSHDRTDHRAAEEIEDSARVVEEKQPSDRTDKVVRYVRRALGDQLARRAARVGGDRLQWGVRGNGSSQVLTCAAVAMLLGPAIETVSGAVDQWQSMDGMQRLSKAILAHVNDRGHYPARAIFAENNQPLLSWRVHLLPFLGHASLYDEFRLEEPWDSEHNFALIRQMPAVYQNPRRSSDFRTTLMVPVGIGTMFEGVDGLPRHGITDGVARTLMLVEADDEHAVFWTQPHDWPYDEGDPWNGLGQSRKVGFMAASADGVVRFYRRSLDRFALRALFSRGHDSQIPDADDSETTAYRTVD